MSLSDTQKAAFAEQGVLRLTSVFGSASSMVDSIWTMLSQNHGIRRDDPVTWVVRQPTGFQALTRAGVFNAIAGSALIAALDDLLGAGLWSSTEGWGAPLVTFPEHGHEWDVPRGQWHLDFPARGPTDQLPGVRILAFIDAVPPAGGGTVVVTGSHRLVERLVSSGRAQDGHSAQVRNALAASHSWFHGLWSKADAEPDRIGRFMSDGERIDGVHVRVEELTGTRGEVVLMHPWTFHAPAPNCGRTPRFTISHSVFRRLLR